MRICPHVKFDAKTSRDTARRPVFQKTQRDAKTRSPALTPVINETPAGHKPDQSTQYHLYCTFPLIKSQGNFRIFVCQGREFSRRRNPAARFGSGGNILSEYRYNSETDSLEFRLSAKRTARQIPGFSTARVRQKIHRSAADECFSASLAGNPVLICPAWDGFPPPGIQTPMGPDGKPSPTIPF